MKNSHIKLQSHFLENAELKAISERFLGWPHRYADFRTLCILIIDRNRFHPETPIQNPGGVLRALTQRHGAGELNLVGSLIGVSKGIEIRWGSIVNGGAILGHGSGVIVVSRAV